MGAMGKSAQFLLHTWLPDAMEARRRCPPSSTRTMVTAGVFMVAPLSPLSSAPNAQTVVTGIAHDGDLRGDRRPGARTT